MDNKSSSSGVGFGTVVFIVFLILKLCNVIDWSWWWVTSPLWISFGLWLIICLPLIIYVKVDNAKLKKNMNKTFSKWDWRG